MSEMNPGFSFYQDFWTAIKVLPEEQQKEVCWAIAKYGIEGELVDGGKYPVACAMVSGWRRALDNSVGRWNQNKVKASKRADAVVSRDVRIAELLEEGISSSVEISKRLSAEFGEISDSAVRKSKAWKERKSKGNAEDNVTKLERNHMVKILKNQDKTSTLERVNSREFHSEKMDEIGNFTKNGTVFNF